MTANGEQKSSRRRFLKTSALTGAGGVAAAAAWNGVSPYMLREEMVFDLNQSYWAKALPAPNPPLQENIDAEVVIIGGGLCGLSTAYYLKKDGATKARVVVLEAMRCGNGASARNGAMMLTMTADRYMQWSGDSELDKRIYDLKARVVVLEAMRCGNGASARNGAMMLTMTADRYMQWSGDSELDKRIYDL